MHTALAIFFVGLVIFLGPLRDSLAWVVGAITAVTYTALLDGTYSPPRCVTFSTSCTVI